MITVLVTVLATLGEFTAFNLFFPPSEKRENLLLSSFFIEVVQKQLQCRGKKKIKGSWAFKKKKKTTKRNK